MHERERHRIILSATQEKAVVTVQDIAELTDASEATIRRDIASLHVQGKLRRVRGGAEAVHPPQLGNLAARPFRVSDRSTSTRNAQLRAKLLISVMMVMRSS